MLEGARSMDAKEGREGRKEGRALQLRFPPVVRPKLTCSVVMFWVLFSINWDEANIAETEAQKDSTM